MNEAAYVLRAAAEISLDYRAARAVVTVHAPHKIKSALGIDAAFHIDADETADSSGCFNKSGHIRFAGFEGKVDTELRQFQRHIWLKAGSVQCAQGTYVHVAAGGRFIEGVDVFAEVIERGGDAFATDATADLKRLIESLARDETR